MADTSIGLDIATTCVRAAQVRLSRGQVRLDKIGQMALPDGAVRDGEVANPEAVGQAIKELWKAVGFRSKDYLHTLFRKALPVNLLGLLKHLDGRIIRPLAMLVLALVGGLVI